MKNPKVRQVVLPLITAVIWGSSFVTQSLSAGSILACFQLQRAARHSRGRWSLLVLLACRAAHAPARKIYARAGKARAAARRALSAARCLRSAINLQQFGMKDDERGQGGLYHGALHRARAGVRHCAIGKKAKQEHLALRDRLPWRGFTSCALTGGECAFASAAVIFMCSSAAFAFTAPDPCCGPFCAAGGRHCAFLRAVRQWSSCSRPSARLHCGEHTTLDGGEDLPPVSCSMSAWCRAAWATRCQIIAQKDGDPTVVSLLLSLESFFAVVSRRDLPARAHEPA